MDRKSKQRQRFPNRAAAAARTRHAIVEAAIELFVARGYVATTISAIAERAGVGRATVFTSVPGGKPELLKLARDRAIAGDDESIPVSDRPWFVEAMSSEDPHTLLRLQSRNYRMIQQRAATLERCLVVGAAQAQELADLLAEASAQRSMGSHLVVERLVELGAVRRRGLERAADTLFALASPDVYLLLTEDRGWSPSEYEEWLAGQLVAGLLAQRPRPSGGPTTAMS